MTTEQFRNQTKDVTRRFGWKFLKQGDVVLGVEKGMGLKAGEKVTPLGLIEIVAVRQEPLNAITQSDVVREGFPEWTPAQFVQMLVGPYRVDPTVLINRIEYRYL